MEKVEQVEQGVVGNTKTTPKPKQSIQSCHWCFTVNNPEGEKKDEYLEQKNNLFALCSQWIYQLEEGEEKTPHWQGYFKLTKKMRFSQLKKICPSWHFEKTNNIKASIEYCQKDEGRINGPWSLGFRAKTKDPLKNKTLRPFQKKILDIIKEEPDDRTIHWFWETRGNIGKTTLAKHLALNFPNQMLYLGGKSNDMKYAIQKFLEEEKNELKIVIMDFTRTTENYISYEGIESIKNGIFFSNKYETGMVIFNPPHIICLANFQPNTEALSEDRWDINEIET